MNPVLIAILFAVALEVGFVVLIGRLAAQKGYDRTTWVVLGLLFNLAALIIVLVLPVQALPAQCPPRGPASKAKLLRGGP